MSFLLIGLVGAAYMLSSQLRITSLGGDYLQATYNAESALELSLYQLKHRREGFEATTSLSDSTPGKSPKNTIDAEIQYRLTPATKTIDIPLDAGSKKLALYFEDSRGELQNLRTMPGLSISLTAKGTANKTGKCAEVNLVGVTKEIPPGRTNKEFESISSEIACNVPTKLANIIDENPRTYTVSSTTATYPFGQFIQDHDSILLLMNGSSNDNHIALEVQGVNSTNTIASPSRSVIATGSYGSVVIRKFIELSQDQLPDLFSRVLVQ